MKKLRFVSIVIVFLLFCPFIKQCDGLTRRVDVAAESIPDSTVIISNDKVYNEPIEPIIEEQKENYSNELKTYFTEESQNVFELSFQLISFFDKNKKEDFNYKTDDIALVCSMIFSSLLIITSIIGAIRIFTNRFKKTNWFYILNISFAVLIVISNMFVWLDRFGQIKIGFYLLLLSNFYMLYLLKQKKEQIQN